MEVVRAHCLHRADDAGVASRSPGLLPRLTLAGHDGSRRRNLLARRRGKGWLRISTSHWQLLGFSLSPLLSATAVPLGPSPTPSPDWVVTYFSSTLFTPAGLDIYARDPRGVDEDKVRALTAEIERLGGEVARLVKGGKMFRIPHGDEGEEVRTSK